jgi:hypothetical protein
MAPSFDRKPTQHPAPGVSPVAAGALRTVAHAQLTAAIHAAQRSSRTAQVAARLRAGAVDVRAEGFAALPGPEAPSDMAVRPGGSFHPPVARRRRVFMKGIFTVAG